MEIVKHYLVGGAVALLLATGAASAQEYTKGIVKKIDVESKKVTVIHEELKSLGMPAMTMAYGVKDSTWLDKFKDGQKVRFALNDAMLITQIESVK